MPPVPPVRMTFTRLASCAWKRLGIPYAFVADPLSKEDAMDRKEGRNRVSVAAVIVLLIAGGCSGMNANLAGEKVSRGEKAVADAKESSAILNAPDDLAVAQGKLAAARDAFAKQDYESAARQADQASVDADYARARATTRKNRKTADEMKKNIETLRQEIERMTK